MGGRAKDICAFDKPVAVFFNDNGDALHLYRNYLLKNKIGQPCEVIRRTFFAVSVSDGVYVSLTDT